MFGLPISRVQDVFKPEGLTRVPLAAPEIAGLLNLRGRIVTVLDLLDVEGIGLKTASTLYRQFKISSLEDLRKFVEGGGLELVDGVGEKSAERIRRSIL